MAIIPCRASVANGGQFSIERVVLSIQILTSNFFVFPENISKHREFASLKYCGYDSISEFCWLCRWICLCLSNADFLFNLWHCSAVECSDAELTFCSWNYANRTILMEIILLATGLPLSCGRKLIHDYIYTVRRGNYGWNQQTTESSSLLFDYTDRARSSTESPSSKFIHRLQLFILHAGEGGIEL